MGPLLCPCLPSPDLGLHRSRGIEPSTENLVSSARGSTASRCSQWRSFCYPLLAESWPLSCVLGLKVRLVRVPCFGVSRTVDVLFKGPAADVIPACVDLGVEKLRHHVSDSSSNPSCRTGLGIT